MKNNIQQRDERTEERKEAKKIWDQVITLSKKAENGKTFLSPKKLSGKTVRLLDEGTVVTASGQPDFYIKKGTIQKYFDGKNESLENIDDDYKGTINLGHIDIATFPVGLIGTWKKSDLTVTDNGEGRQGLDVDLHLNDENPLVKSLEVLPMDVGVSVEMLVHWDREASDKYGIAIADEICIYDFAVVGECGNVGSSETLSLKGVNMENKAETLLEKAENEEEVIKAKIMEEEETEETAEEAEETEETVEGIGEDGEEGEGEESGEEVLSALEEMKNKMTELEAKTDALKKDNNRLKKKLKAKEEKDKEVSGKLKEMSISVGLTKKEKKEKVVPARYSADMDGIGE